MRPSTRQAALAVAAALLVALAGCSGGTVPTSSPTATAAPSTTATGTPPATSTGTPTPTSAATPTSRWSPNASEQQYPPGVAANGTLTNVSALLDAHVAATANGSMELTYEWSGPNESGVRRYAHGASATPYYSVYNRTTDGDRTTEQFYWTGTHGYARITFDDRTRFAVYQNATGSVGAWTHEDVFGRRSTLRSALVGGNYSVNGTVERGDRTFVQLTADEVSSTQTQIYEAYEGTVLVTPEGVVYDVDTSLVGTSNAMDERLETSIELDTDVDWSGPPPWVADLPHLSVATVEDGHAVEIRNTGGAALPANATFTVAVSNETVWGSTIHGDATATVTTDVRLEPGDAVYVTVGSDGEPSSFALHQDRARGEYTIVAAGVRGTNANVSYRLETGSESS